MYLGTPVVSVDAAGGAPAPVSVQFPTEWAGGTARVLRYAARLTTTGTVTWDPVTVTTHTTSIDPGFSGSILDVAAGDTTTATLASSGATAGGSPTASVYLAMLAAISDGVDLTPAGGAGAASLDTGHASFIVLNAPAGSTWVQAVVSLGATPPTITDAAGFVWTQLVQQQFGGGWLTVWTAPVASATGDPGPMVTLSEACDSGVGLALAGQAP